MSPSTMRYKEAVKLGREDGIKNCFKVPSHFDERQVRLYHKHFYQVRSKCEWFDEIAEDMANMHGFTYKELNGKKVLVKIDEH